jgi:lipid-binding SYLF domain-containing protein
VLPVAASEMSYWLLGERQMLKECSQQSREFRRPGTDFRRVAERRIGLPNEPFSKPAYFRRASIGLAIKLEIRGAIAMKTLTALMLSCAVLPLCAQKKEDTRLTDSYNVMKEILGTPDKGIPRDLLNKSYCVVVFPSVKKAGFIVGAEYGRGVITCRSGAQFNGPWSAPSMFAIEGASFGLQIGGEATDFVLLVMNEKGAGSVLTSKVKMGADASAAAGPVGRTASAETDAALKAEILSYSRARGVFGGLSLEGSTLRTDEDGNKDIYGQKLSAKEVVRDGKVKTPAAGKALIDLLQMTSPKHGS